MDRDEIKRIIEIGIFASTDPISITRLKNFFPDNDELTKQEIKAIIAEIAADYADRGIELKEVASGFRFQIRQQYADYVRQLWQEKPPRYTRATLETLALIAYRQPITRGEIEDIRGVSVSSQTVRALIDRDWVRVVGHRDVPGHPSLLATTKEFLDYFNLKSLEELPTLQELQNIDELAARLNIQLPEPVNSEEKVESGNDGDESNEEAVNEADEVSVEEVVNEVEELVEEVSEENLVETEEQVEEEVA